MTRYLLDTNVVSELGRTSPAATVHKRYQAKEDQSAIALPSESPYKQGEERLEEMTGDVWVEKVGPVAS